MDFDPTNAPPGYRAIANPNGRGCRLPGGTECALRLPSQPCLLNAPGSPECEWQDSDPMNSCICKYRPDETEAIFVKDLYGNEED